MSNRLHQMRFAKAHPAVNVERVVLSTGGCGNVLRRSNGKLIGIAVDVVFKRQSRQETSFLSSADIGLRRAGRGLLSFSRFFLSGNERDGHRSIVINVGGDSLNILEVSISKKANF